MRFRHNWALFAFVGSVIAAGPAATQDLSALEARVKELEKASDQRVVRRSKKSMSLTLSGHVNRAIQFRDNGSESGVLHVTNNLSRTRVLWIGEGRINGDLTVGSLIELGNQSSISSSQDLGDNGDDDGPDVLGERQIELTISSNTLGKLSLGQGDTASENAASADLSGTAMATVTGDPFFAGGR